MASTWQGIDHQNRADNIEALKVWRNLGVQFVRPTTGAEAGWLTLAAGVTHRLIELGVVSQTLVNDLDSHLKAYRTRKSEENE